MERDKNFVLKPEGGLHLKILVACEYSGIVRDAFTRKGHYAMSCDLLPTESPGPHYQGNVLDVLYDGWDMLIGFPPCTYLSNAGGHYLKTQPDRHGKMIDGAQFFNNLLNAPIARIAIENPIQHGEARKLIRKYDQVVQPFYFGHNEKKTTCLWLKNLKPLIPTEIVTVKPKGQIKKSDGRNYYYWFHQGKNPKDRAKFWPGIADAMAEQWSNLAPIRAQGVLKQNSSAQTTLWNAL